MMGEPPPQKKKKKKQKKFGPWNINPLSRKWNITNTKAIPKKSRKKINKGFAFHRF
jgi:hypothetical protein